MQFGHRGQERRNGRGLTQRELNGPLSVSISYISKVANKRLPFGDYSAAKVVHKRAAELAAGKDERLLPTDRVRPSIRKRIRQHPDTFRPFAEHDDVDMDELVVKLGTSKK